MEYPGIAPEIGTKIKELTVAGNDPAEKKEFNYWHSGRTLFGNSYWEYSGDKIIL